MKIKAKEIADLPAGSIVLVNGVEWTRLADSGYTEGLNDALCNPKDGDWIRWMALCYFDDEVELIRKGGEVQS
jgi:hypothetical protein